MKATSMPLNRKSVQTLLIVLASVAFAIYLVGFNGENGGAGTAPSGSPSSVPSTPVASAPGDGAGGVSTGDRDSETGLVWILESDLPDIAQDTLALIDQGGPYPYDRDGVTFENREGILPDHPRGYYREYTVVAPGAANRGPLRIVTGSSNEYFWTEDHYKSFERVSRRTS